MNKLMTALATAALLACITSGAQAQYGCTRGSIFPGGCDSLFQGGGRSIMPDGGQSLFGRHGGQSMFPGGGRSMFPDNNLGQRQLREPYPMPSPYLDMDDDED